jgi:hypothetical protein
VTLLVEIALVALSAVGVAVALALLPRAPSARRRAPAAARRSRPEQLLRLERLVGTAGLSALHAHAYLRPVLAEIASRRLAARGLAIERMQPPVGAGLLGERLWVIVRPDRPFPDDRDAPGVSTDELSAMLDSLEQL